MPLLSTRVTESASRRPLVRHIDSLDCKSSSNVEDETMASNVDCIAVVYCDIGVNTDLTMQDIESLELKVKELNENLKETESKC